MMVAFLTCRLVVDTGINVMGWSLEQARDYLREHAFMPETEIRSESIRYSCDIPGQALAYKLGDRSEEHTSELQSLMRISYAVFCLKKKKNNKYKHKHTHNTTRLQSPRHR